MSDQQTISTERRLGMTEQTIPEYGALIRIEDCKAGFYLREKALDAIQEQAIEELNEALSVLSGRRTVIESDHESLGQLISDLRQAAELAQVAWELAWSKRPEEEDEV